MSRKDELIDLKNELEQTPIELEYIALKAVARAKKSKRRSMMIKAPMVSFCSVIVAFVLLVNLFPNVALAMSNVPILKELVSAVAFDPSLKAAVDHEYYQVVGERQSQDDVTVTVDYMILDAGHISIFYKLHAPFNDREISCELKDKNGKELEASSNWDFMEVDKLKEIKIDFVDNNTTPDQFTFTFIIKKDSFLKGTSTIDTRSSSEDANMKESNKKEYRFSFQLHSEKKFTQTATTIPLNQWISIKEQRIKLKRLDINPTQAKLYFDFDEDNSAVIQDLQIYFKDERGDIYKAKTNGVTSWRDPKTDNIIAIIYDSSYFSNAKHLTLCIEGITMIYKDKLYGEINYSNKSITNLPDGVSVESMTLAGDSLNMITLKANTEQTGSYKQLISSEYYDLEGKSYQDERLSMDTEDKGIYHQYINIKNYKDHKYKIKWTYAPEQTIKAPISIKLK